MRKLVFGGTFLVTGLTAKAAAAGAAAIQPVLCILAILLGLALLGLVVLIPALLLSSAIRRFFSHQDAESDEPEARFFVLTSAMEARPPEIAAKR